MKQRVVSSLVGLVILAVVLVFLDTVLLNLVVGIICVIGVWEMLNATGCTKIKGLTALSMLFTLIIPFARVQLVRPYLVQALFFIIIAFFLLLLKSHSTMRIEHFAMAFLFSCIVPLFFSCASFIRDDYGTAVGGFYLLLALGSAWLCDTCAYFTGMRFGKHKLAPQISPKKTVEGAIGGMLGCTLLMLLLACGYAAVMAKMGVYIHMNYIAIALATPFFALAGMLGDLSASVIKRQFNVKDYGTIMPGHGGILDRFDSVLFTLPCVYIAVQHIHMASL